MTDPSSSPEQEAVRRLLAEARHDEPLPDDVRTRLDSTLDELVASRTITDETVPIVDLAARRRRRRASALLAAAALVVGGISIGQVLDRSGHDEVGADAASSATDDRAATKDELYDEPQAGAPQSPAPEADASTEKSTLSRAIPEARSLSSKHLVRDLTRLRDTGIVGSASLGGDYSGLACSLDVVGDRVAVTLDGEPAVAVFADVVGGSQRVEVHSCAATRAPLVRTLPAP